MGPCHYGAGLRSPIVDLVHRVYFCVIAGREQLVGGAEFVITVAPFLDRQTVIAKKLHGALAGDAIQKRTVSGDHAILGPENIGGSEFRDSGLGIQHHHAVIAFAAGFVLRALHVEIETGRLGVC